MWQSRYNGRDSGSTGDTELISTTIALGLVNWLVTLLLVESEVTRPMREWVQHQFEKASNWEAQLITPTVRNDGWRVVLWYKAKYFVGCQLCTGTWIGWLMAAFTPWNRPLGTGVLGVLLAGFLYKAIGHLVLIIQKKMEQ